MTSVHVENLTPTGVPCPTCGAMLTLATLEGPHRAPCGRWCAAPPATAADRAACHEHLKGCAICWDHAQCTTTPGEKPMPSTHDPHVQSIRGHTRIACDHCGSNHCPQVNVLAMMAMPVSVNVHPTDAGPPPSVEFKVRLADGILRDLKLSPGSFDQDTVHLYTPRRAALWFGRHLLTNVPLMVAPANGRKAGTSTNTELFYKGSVLAITARLVLVRHGGLDRSAAVLLHQNAAKNNVEVVLPVPDGDPLGHVAAMGATDVKLVFFDTTECNMNIR